VWGECGFGNINLEQHARRDQIARVSRATVAGAVAGDRATTPIAISFEPSSELSSDESLESIGTLMRQWRGERDEPQSSQMSSDLESLGAIFRQEIERKRRL
jgi:hypothetical protein